MKIKTSNLFRALMLARAAGNDGAAKKIENYLVDASVFSNLTKQVAEKILAGTFIDYPVSYKMLGRSLATRSSQIRRIANSVGVKVEIAFEYIGENGVKTSSAIYGKDLTESLSAPMEYIIV